MPTRKKTQPFSSDKVAALYDKVVDGVAKAEYAIRPPMGWNELTQPQLRYVLALLAMGKTPDETAIYCLMRLTGMEVVERRGSKYWIVRHEGRLLQIGAHHLAWCADAMEWLFEVPEQPVRLDEADGHAAINEQLHGLPFGDYIRLENYYQGYLMSKDEKAIDAMATILYPGAENIEPHIRYGIVLWMASVKKLFGQLWPDFFRPATSASDGTPPDMRAVMVAEIRALTGGDVTKNSIVLAADTWDALTELNEKAREAREFNEKMKK